MKVIDLLNKIANGEEVPKEIKVNDNIYHYDETDCNEFYRYRTMAIEFLTDYADLNDKVEIIEDKPKKDKIEYFDDYKIDVRNIDELIDSINLYIELSTNKLNEIINKINEEE